MMDTRLRDAHRAPTETVRQMELVSPEGAAFPVICAWHVTPLRYDYATNTMFCLACEEAELLAGDLCSHCGYPMSEGESMHPGCRAAAITEEA